MLRERGSYLALEGEWHLSRLEHTEDALEPCGLSDCQQRAEIGHDRAPFNFDMFGTHEVMYGKRKDCVAQSN
jgi:hypothetical protein